MFWLYHREVTLDDVYEMWAKTGHKHTFESFVDAVLGLGYRIV